MNWYFFITFVGMLCLTHSCCPWFVYFIKSHTLNEVRPKNVLGSSHHTNRFCRGWVRPNPNINMVLEPIQNLFGHLLSGHCYRATQITLQMSNSGRERGVLRVSHWVKFGLEICLYLVDSTHVTTQFCKGWVRSNSNSNIFHHHSCYFSCCRISFPEEVAVTVANCYILYSCNTFSSDLSGTMCC